MLFCLSDPNDNFRKRVCADYKGNRGKTRKPTGYKALVDWVKDNYATAMRPAIEADDVMGIISSKPENEGKCIIVSDDKDMKTLKCKLYRPTAGEQLDISQADADRFFLTQCLTGDTADNIKGCPGYGPVKAERALGPAELGCCRKGVCVRRPNQRGRAAAGTSRQDLAPHRMGQ